MKELYLFKHLEGHKIERCIKIPCSNEIYIKTDKTYCVVYSELDGDLESGVGSDLDIVFISERQFDKFMDGEYRALKNKEHLE